MSSTTAELFDDLLAAEAADTRVAVPSTTALLDDLLAAAPINPRITAAAAALDFVLEGDADALRCLLASDAGASINVNARSPISGRALLHEACANGLLPIVKLLLEKTDADLMLRTMLGRCTPLHLAVTNNHRAAVFLLLSYGADALSRDRFGASPIHYAQSLSVAKLLVQYGGRVLDYNSKRKNALESLAHLAATNNMDDIDAVTRRELHTFLQHEAEREHKRTLETLRATKKTHASSTQSIAFDTKNTSKRHQHSKQKRVQKS